MLSGSKSRTGKATGRGSTEPQAEWSPLAPPSFFSLAFHLDFFPNVLRYRFRQYKVRSRKQREHVLLEIPAVLLVCGVLIAYGAPSAIKRSVIGIVLCVLGAIGFGSLIGAAVISEYKYRAREKYRYTYQQFVPSIFVFFVMLGLTSGLLLERTSRSSALVVAESAAALILGYVAGIFAGLWIRCLGFMTVWFVYFANLATTAMVVAAVILIKSNW